MAMNGIPNNLTPGFSHRWPHIKHTWPSVVSWNWPGLWWDATESQYGKALEPLSSVLDMRTFFLILILFLIICLKFHETIDGSETSSSTILDKIKHIWSASLTNMVTWHFTPKTFHPGTFHPGTFYPTYISPNVRFTPRTFLPTYVSPHVRFTPRTFHPTYISPQGHVTPN